MNMRRFILILTLITLCIAGAGQASAFYNPGTGRWLSKDPAGEFGGNNLYVFVQNDPANKIDPLGEWTVSFEGSGWTQERRNYVNARLADVNRKTGEMINRLDALIGKANAISGGCCLKTQLLKDLKGWRKGLLVLMKKRLDDASYNLPLRMADLSGQDASAQAHFPGKFFLGNEYSNFTGMDIDPSSFFSSEGAANDDLFHELSHVSGTIDTHDEDDPRSALWDAHEITPYFDRSNNYQMINYFNLLRRKLGTGKCSQTDLQWNQ